MTLPTEIRLSYGTAISLGLLTARQEVPPTTAYLLWDPGCQGSCSFCQRGDANTGETRLARIIWPLFPLSEVIQRLCQKPHSMRRLCVQTAWNETNAAVLPGLCAALKPAGLPICLTLHPAQIPLAHSLLDGAADQIGIGLDAAGPATYDRHKHRDWHLDWPIVEHLMQAYPGRIEIHQIFGLGDTEAAFLRTMDRIYELGGKAALFAYTPSGGAGFQGEPPPRAAWRRIQVFRHLRENSTFSLASCRFDHDRLIDTGIPRDRLQELLSDGTAFRTSGCGDCNRPFYNEKPGGFLYNFPRPLTADEARRALTETGLLGP